MTGMYLEHYGIKGMKWGIRRYQNPDGTLTAAGKKRLENYKATETITAKRNLDSATQTYNRFKHARQGKGKALPSRRENQAESLMRTYERELKVISKIGAPASAIKGATAGVAVTSWRFAEDAKTKNRLKRYEQGK